jgi:hypothetical protein
MEKRNSHLKKQIKKDAGTPVPAPLLLKPILHTWIQKYYP